MTHLLLIADADTLNGLGSMLRNAGYEVQFASSGQRALDVLEHRHVDLVVSEFFLRDMSGLQLLQRLRFKQSLVPFLLTGSATTREAVDAMRLGAADVVEEPLDEEMLLPRIRAALQTAPFDATPQIDTPAIEEAHAAARWARALAPVITSAKDPRTVSGWSRLVFVSPGALRNWCRTAGVSARRSLVFARLLRVAFLSQGGRHRPEDLLDVVDRRTFVGLLKFAGLDPERPFPTSAEEFLRQQTLVRDPDRLFEIRRALSEYQRPAAAAAGEARGGASRTASRTASG
jgi:CheY-like chemotaxis protein